MDIVFFFSREEARIHVHVMSGTGEAKFWLSPAVELAKNYGLSNQEISKVQKIIEDNIDEIQSSWNKHFPH